MGKGDLVCSVQQGKEGGGELLGPKLGQHPGHALLIDRVGVEVQVGVVDFVVIEDLAEAIGVSQAAISDIENGRRTTSFENLASICTHYNVSADYLLGLIDEPRTLTPPKKGGT